MAKKILVIDDEEDFLRALEIRLTYAGFNTLSATNGLAALELINRNVPDLIVLDVQMPKMDGLEFISRIRRDNRYKSIPVIILTAGAFDISEEYETLAAANDFLLKSVDNEQIVDRINNCF
jgi:CheY-like chemotaxis protein